MKQVHIELPRLHASQARVVAEAKRFNVVCAGRRWGKNIVAQDRVVRCVLAGKRAGWFTPTYKYLDVSWRELKKTFEAIATINEQQKRCELRNGGVLECWSLEDADAGRSRDYHLVVIDEAAKVPNLSQAWNEAIRPTLVNTEGDAWFLSSPKGLNFFHTLYGYGQDPNRPDWASWRMPTSENPAISKAEIESTRSDMLENAFLQEIEAQFLANGGTVFRNVTNCIERVPGQPKHGHQYVFGLDFGRSKDSTACAVLDVTARSVVLVDRFTRLEYALQMARLRALYEKWYPSAIVGEQNSMGGPLLEQLKRDGLPIRAFTTTNSSKSEIIEHLALLLEQLAITLPDDQVVISEFLAFESSTTSGGLTRYSAPDGQHDDTVMAIALAAAQLDNGPLQKRRHPALDIKDWQLDSKTWAENVARDPAKEDMQTRWEPKHGRASIDEAMRTGVWSGFQRLN